MSRPSLLLLILMLGSRVAWADEVIVCDPSSVPVPQAVTRWERSIDGDPFKTQPTALVWQAPHVLMTPEEQATMTHWRQQLDALALVPVRYWQCLDGDTDGVVDGVHAMSSTERDAIDAPALFAAARQQGFLETIQETPGCVAEFADIHAQVHAMQTEIHTQIEAANNTASLKTALMHMNLRIMTLVEHLATCVRARAG